MYPNERMAIINIVLATLMLFMIPMLLKCILEFGDDAIGISHTETYYLQSVDFNSELKGRFTLGRGYIDETQYYYAYKINDDGSKEMYKMKVDYTKIYESLENNDIAYVNVDISKLGSVLEYRLYVPKNTIEKEYDLTLGD